MDPNARERLAEIIRREIDSPGSHGPLLEALKEASLADAPTLEFLAAEDEHHRNAFYAKAQHVWTRRLGWRIMRPLFIVAVLAAVGFCLQRAVDPTLGVTLFLGGAAALYIAIQLFAHVWAERDLRKTGGIDARYRDRLRALLEDLGGNKS